MSLTYEILTEIAALLRLIVEITSMGRRRKHTQDSVDVSTAVAPRNSLCIAVSVEDYVCSYYSLAGGVESRKLAGIDKSCVWFDPHPLPVFCIVLRFPASASNPVDYEYRLKKTSIIVLPV